MFLTLFVKNDRLLPCIVGERITLPAPLADKNRTPAHNR